MQRNAMKVVGTSGDRTGLFAQYLKADPQVTLSDAQIDAMFDDAYHSSMSRRSSRGSSAHEDSRYRHPESCRALAIPARATGSCVAGPRRCPRPPSSSRPTGTIPIPRTGWTPSSQAVELARPPGGAGGPFSRGVCPGARCAPSCRRQVRGALLVSPPDLEFNADVPEAARSFAPVPRDPLPFPSLLVISASDPYCNARARSGPGQRLGFGFPRSGGRGHINVASGHGPWPEGLLMFTAADAAAVSAYVVHPHVPALEDYLPPPPGDGAHPPSLLRARASDWPTAGSASP